MALSEKQAVVIGLGGLACLYLLRHHTAAKGKPLAKRAIGKGSPALIPSSANRPSTNLATRNATATAPQVASTIGFPGGIKVPTSVFDQLLSRFFPTLHANTSKPATQSPKTAPAGGGSPSSGSSSGRPSVAAGGNPWSSSGDYVGRSSVTTRTPDNGGALQGYDTGLSSSSDAGGDVGIVAGGSPQNTDLLNAAHGSIEADGTPSDDPSAIEYEGPQMPAGYNPETGTFDDAGPQLPGGYDPETGAYAWQGPIETATDTAPLESSPLPDYYNSYDDSAAVGGGESSDIYAEDM